MTKQTVIKNPTWWRRRTSMERNMTILAAVAWCLVAALVVALAIFVVRQRRSETLPSLPAALSNTDNTKSDSNNSKSSSTSEPAVCLTPGCVHSASSVLSSMDLTAEPCDDFYQFACGSYIRDTLIPDDKSTVSRFSAVTDKLQEQLRSVIDAPITAKDTRPFRLVKNLFRACMNRTHIEARGLAPLHDILHTLGGWPVLDGPTWDEGGFDWRQSVYKFRAMGYSVDYFMDFSVSTDVKNSTMRSISVDQASLGISREYLTKGFGEKIVDAYYNYLVDIATILGAPKERAEKEIRDSVEFEMHLANISLPSEERRNVTKLYNPMKVRDMQSKFPSIPWLTYFNSILPKHMQITEDEVIVVGVPSYIQGLERLLEQTPKRVLANYVMSRVAGASVNYMNQELRSRQLKFSTALSGKTEREARWKECIDIVSGGLSISVGSLYVRKFFKEEAKVKAMEMVEDIRNEFIDILMNVDWMDQKTKERGLEKARAMAVHIAYPDELLDDSKLEGFYEKLEVDPNLYLESILNVTTFGMNYSFGRLRTKVNKTEWITHGRPAIVNAFYSSIENSIQFPAGILQGAFFNSQRPRYMNYGAIGFVIGHEITHGFDDQGRQFDKNGNLVEWWEPDTKKKYLQKAKCIIEQYGNYTDEETAMHLNGINTQGENIADNGGIKEAYYAYLNWAKRSGEEPRLPGLSYSPQQMFWLSAAQTWCTKYRTQAKRQRITTGVHSLGQFRVLGPLSNMREFSEDFGCPLGSPMNPVHKCQVW
ncbi:neprilysin-2-like [Periplaneta americana]|uniref:neprilysin-2-like n=1 Tax=Periplaneta americana TaxID=6978 RepID=UPI0037E7472D